ncbi:hypothetical protein BM221_002672 [Beauveria bassiana]|uniref:Uncharacterized protein n=1 Tax=Beauveria bassiana TaxID=176275 RepID=A0A2N6NZ58_BEABA|nr:hypothetical protein BM221_002672 [Beauveria bassiana]
MASTNPEIHLWQQSLKDRSQYEESFKQIFDSKAPRCEGCELLVSYDDEKATQLAASLDRLWVYDRVVDDPNITSETSRDIGVMTEDSPQDLRWYVWAGRRRALSKNDVSDGDVEAPTVWRGYNVKDFTVENPSSDRICLMHGIKWTDLMLTAVKLGPAIKRAITQMHSSSTELTPRLRRPAKSIDKAVATPHTIAAWREFTGQEVGMRDLVLGHWHTWYIFSILSSTESGGLLAASAAECLTTYTDYVDVTDGGDVGLAGDHMKLAFDGMTSPFIANCPGARAAIWTAASVIRYRALLARDLVPWRASIHDRGPPNTRAALVAALPDPLELTNLRMLDGSMLASYLATVAGTLPDERPSMHGATMSGHTSCVLVRLATSNLYKYNDITDLQSDITMHEAMNPLAFATVVNGGQVGVQYLSAISRDVDLVLSCGCDSDMHQWAHDMAMGSNVWYALCPRYNALQQVGLYHEECPDTLFDGLPIIVTTASMGNTASAASNDQATFDRDWNLDKNPTTLASEFGISEDGHNAEVAIRMVTRILPMHDMKAVHAECLARIKANPQWSRDEGPAQTGGLLVQLISDLALRYEIMDHDELDQLTGHLNEYIELTVNACEEQKDGQIPTYLTDEFCMRQSRLYINFYDFVAKMHPLQDKGLHCRRFAVGAMSLFFDGWKYGSYVAILRYAGL